MEELRIKRRDAIGLLAMFWTWALKSAPDGDITQFPPQAIADATDWSKKAQTLLDALIKCQWVDRTENGHLLIHDWDDFTWRYFDKVEQTREQTKKRVAEYRKRKKVLQGNVKSVTNVTPTPLPVTQCNTPTVPNHTIPTIPYSNKYSTANTVEGKNQKKPLVPLNPNFGKVMEHYQQIFATCPSSIVIEDVKSYLNGNIEPEVLCEAIDDTARASAQKPSAYFRSIMRNWQAEGIRTKEQLDAFKTRGKPQEGVKTVEYTADKHGQTHDSAGHVVL